MRRERKAREGEDVCRVESGRREERLGDDLITQHLPVSRGVLVNQREYRRSIGREAEPHV